MQKTIKHPPRVCCKESEHAVAFSIIHSDAQSNKQAVMQVALRGTLSVMSRKVTQRRDERVMRNHMEDSSTISHCDRRDANRRHNKHFRIRLMSLKRNGILFFQSAPKPLSCVWVSLGVDSRQDYHFLSEWRTQYIKPRHPNKPLHTQAPPPTSMRQSQTAPKLFPLTAVSAGASVFGLALYTINPSHL